MKRKRNWHPEKTRQKIQLTQLINRLQDFVLGKVEPPCRNGFERLWEKNLPLMPDSLDGVKDLAEQYYDEGADLPRVEMSPAQVTAAGRLVNKCMPDLSSAEITNYAGDQEKTPDQRSEELVNNYGEMKTRILLDEPLGWMELKELQDFEQTNREWLEKTRPQIVND